MRRVGVRMKRGWRVLLAALVLSAQPAAAAPSAKALSALDARLQQIMQAWNPAGMAVAVIADDKVVFLQGYGVTSTTRDGSKVDGDTLFQLASISKPLSSALIGTYVDQGRLAWSDRIVDRLPWFRVGDDAVTADLRLEDALSHRSDVEATNWLIDVPGMTWRGAAERLRTLPQQAPVRSTMIYDNVMYSTGGLMLVEQGEDYAKALSGRLFAPLGMRRSLGDFEALLQREGVAACHECELADGPGPVESVMATPNVAVPHVRVRDLPSTPIRWRHVATTAASSGMSSAADMARFLRMMLNGGTLDGVRVLKPETVAEILRLHSLARPGRTQPIAGFLVEQARIADWSQGYALGWYAARYAGVDIRHHGGGLLGVGGSVIMAPDRKVAVVVLTNDRLYSSNHVLAAAYSALDTALGLPAADWTGYMRIQDQRAAAEAEASIPAREGTSLNPPARLAGRYCHPAYGELTVAADAAGLAISQGEQRHGRLLRVSGDRFALRWDGPRFGGRPLAFQIGPDGAASALDVDAMRFAACGAP
ncbi:MAG: serine hydrolase [Phenylobacterium sp.]|uniref:serine hydrolase n=1 Tax=Phenylobacterium sp. TaxID=1871053 RepID=UPI0012280A1F|nr:serine hydrolase [Phenylobacterium sp.]TAJ73896.1 MAG: serine hydrolase [Phenylobacterium sp.]